jgi:hypothetical protein
MPRPLLVTGVLVTALDLRSSAGTLAGATPTGNLAVKAKLGANHEVPAQAHKVPKASGVLAGTLTKTKTGYSFKWRLTYSKTSGPGTFANVQNATACKHGTVIMSLCGSGTRGSTRSWCLVIPRFRPSTMRSNSRARARDFDPVPWWRPSSSAQSVSFIAT